MIAIKFQLERGPGYASERNKMLSKKMLIFIFHHLLPLLLFFQSYFYLIFFFFFFCIALREIRQLNFESIPEVIIGIKF